ncbi:DUF1566 domain-containing protein [Aeromonas salmonicida]|uniref:DUF1566 domain-containing protein n=1 Tax=Aeromonas salmonicida TaxID=645 RepID=UPI0024A7F602|nr:DUF1566 domain-containing protein [Aeromonas salmonicida]MDM5135902.1 DUF1566 domain-containing protein [Aeromonas salmonicida]WHF43002.1 DUF1566 domain-containing protein [Aeromonas salmonicida]
MQCYFPPLLLIATLLPVTSQARECLPGYQDDHNRFVSEQVDTAEGKLNVVNDRATGLQWLYCPYGQHASADGTGCEGTPAFISTRANAEDNPLMGVIKQANDQLGTPAQPWRAPDIKELFTLYNNQCQPAIYAAQGYPATSLQSQIVADKETLCADAASKWDKVTEQWIEAPDDVKAACRSAEQQLWALTNIAFGSDSSGGEGYDFLNFASSGETFNVGGIGLSSVMLRLVRPIPTIEE